MRLYASKVVFDTRPVDQKSPLMNKVEVVVCRHSSKWGFLKISQICQEISLLESLLIKLLSQKLIVC